jgi:hypothetical protein
MGRPTDHCKFTPFALAFLALWLQTSIAEAGCSPIPGRSAVTVNFLTYYAPAYGGTNGKCGTSASGKDACKYYLEDHMKGNTPATFAAVAQKGGSSKMYGGLFVATTLANLVGAPCILIAAGDRYGTGSNSKSKMDVVVKTLDIEKKYSTLGSKFHGKSGSFLPAGRLKDLKAPSRKIKRTADAEAAIPPNDTDQIADLINAIEMGAAIGSSAQQPRGAQ